MDWNSLFEGLGTKIIGILFNFLGIGSNNHKNNSSSSKTIIKPKISGGDQAIQIQTVITTSPADASSQTLSSESSQQDSINSLPNQHIFIPINSEFHTQTSTVDAKSPATGNSAAVYNIGKQNGITGEELEKITKNWSDSISSITKNFNDIALARIDDLKELTLPRIEKMEHTLEDFSNPATQRFLLEAQQEAMVTDSPDAMKLLSDLIVEHINNYSHKDKQVTIRHAVKVIGEIDPDALRAMTLFYILKNIVPSSPNVFAGLKTINDLIHPLLSPPLPTGSHWIEHLSLLNAVRITPAIRITRLDDYYAMQTDGYVCIGIRENSPQHMQAKELLKKVNIGEEILIPNELLPGYVRIPVSSKMFISQWVLSNGKEKHHITPEERQTILSIFDLYEKNADLQLQVSRNFKSKFSQFEDLTKAGEWWNQIPVYFSPTLVGTVLAVLNGKRYNSDISFPD